MAELPWMAEARRKRAEAERVWKTIPVATKFHRGALIEALRRMGIHKGRFSGELVEGDAFFAKQSTGDLRSLLRDHWYLKAAAGEDYDPEPPDVPDVPEPVFKKRCECRCGYTCGRKCGLPLMECINQHWKKDCDHVWDGPTVEVSNGQSVTCSKCGDSAIGHDMMVGP